MLVSADAISEKDIAVLRNHAKSRYAVLLSGGEAPPWWDAVLLTASSIRQAQHYEEEINRRVAMGQLPAAARYLVVPDLDDERIGSAGATLNALRALVQMAPPDSVSGSLDDWWAARRVLIIHAGGDSRRLPQYSLSGKLFSLLPTVTLWGSPSTLFDEFIALSTTWAERLSGGLVVASGDVLLTLDTTAFSWQRPGVCGVAIRRSIEVGAEHGVYVADAEGRVYSFLQKPTATQVQAAGGLLSGDVVALDSGLLRFDPTISAKLTGLAGVVWQEGRCEIGEGLLARHDGTRPVIDLYEHLALSLTGQVTLSPGAHPSLARLAEALHDVPFWCDLVPGQFTHIGTTRLFRQFMTEGTDSLRLSETQQRPDTITPLGLRSAGVVVDSVLTGGGELGANAVAIECHLHAPIRVGPGAILQGLSNLPGPVVVPEDVVVHQIPVLLPDGLAGTVIRVYGVDDDPKDTVVSGQCTWLGRPILETLSRLGKTEEDVWGNLPATERTLWNAHLFPLGTPDQAWACAQWLMGVASDGSAEIWRQLKRLSLAESARWADPRALTTARHQRQASQWQTTVLGLINSGADPQPLLAHAPGLAPVAATGRALIGLADRLLSQTPTEAASRYFQAHLFLGNAGLVEESRAARHAAYAAVRQAVDAGSYHDIFASQEHTWRYQQVRVTAPARIDLGGGWSDTPPFCLDWGGTVLNLAITMEGAYPICTTLRRLEEPLIRCVSHDAGGAIAEYRCTEEIMAPTGPGCPFAIQRAALALTGLVHPGESLAAALAATGGGLEIHTEVNLPMGSGLGTSSILAVTVLQALAAMNDCPLAAPDLNEQVLRLEQFMTTGGGWQDQAGAIYPGAKLITSGPGLRPRLRVTSLAWSPERSAEFADRLLLYYTGLRRIARDLLAQIVGRYLVRDSTSTQVLHSIKSLAMEMAYALTEGEWDYLGELLDRHWRLNQVLDPNTTNAPIEALLETARPYLAGAKLAGAGGGGFLLMLARTPEAARQLRQCLSTTETPGRFCAWALAEEGLCLELTK